jgi:hypothetical protein
VASELNESRVLQIIKYGFSNLAFDYFEGLLQDTSEVSMGITRINSRASLADITLTDLNGSDVDTLTFETHQYYAVGVTCPPVIGYWKHQVGAPDAWDTSGIAAHATIGGYYVQYFPEGFCTPEHFGAKGDYNTSTLTLVTDDREAIRAAIKASAVYGIECQLIREYGFTCTAASHVIEIPSYARVVRKGTKGKLCTNSPPALPYMWHNNNHDITFDGVVIAFGGTIDDTTFNYHLNATEYNTFFGASYNNRPSAVNVAGLSGNGMSTACILSQGGYNLTFRVEFISLFTDTGATSDSLRYINHGLTITNGNDASRPYNVKVGLYLDGVIMGFTPVAVDDLTVEYCFSRRYGSIGPTASNEGGAYWPPPHAIYCSDNDDSAGTTMWSNVIRINNVYDYGVNRCIADGGLASIKYRSVRYLYIDGVQCIRPHGCLQGSAEYVNIRNVHAEMDYTKCLAGANGAPPLDMPNNTDSNTTMTGAMENVYFRIKNQVTSYVGYAVVPTANFAMRNVVIDLDDVSSGSTPLFVMTTASNVELDIKVINRTAETGNHSILQLNGTCSGIRGKIHLIGYDGANPRMVENTKSAVTNDCVEFVLSGTGKIMRVFAGGLVETEHAVAVDVACTAAAASVTATGIIPDGAVILGLSTVVATAIGNSNGTTGYQVGDGTTVDRFGTNSAITAGSGTGNANWTVATLGATAATNVVLTAVGGNFDGTGMINVIVRYRLSSFTLDTSDV